MTDELISLATRMLREQTDGRSERARETEARIVERVHRGPRWIGLPVRFGLAAALVGSTVWAGADGRFLEFVRSAGERWTSDAADGTVARVTQAAPGVQAASRKQDTLARVKPATGERVDVAPREGLAGSMQDATSRDGARRGESAQDPVAPGATQLPLVESGSQASSKRPESSEATWMPPASAEAPAPGSLATGSLVRAELDAYERAHRLQFTLSDFTGALGAWDAYLAAYPHGSLALEAHFNRALCLVQVGDSTRARRELQPFANGAYGAYRRAESQRLLDRLE